MIKFVIEPSADYHINRGRPYNVSVWTSVDGIEGWWYAGIGKYCRNLSEVFEYVEDYKNPRRVVERWRDKYAPGVEIVDEIPEGWHKVAGANHCPRDAEWIATGSFFWRKNNLPPHEHALLYTGYVPTEPAA